MAKIISASIDLNKIDKSKIVTIDKNGNQFKNGAKYLNIQIVLNDTPDQYGNTAAVRINQTKEEREAGIKPTYLGNGKTVWSDDQNNQTFTPAEQYGDTQSDISDLPF